MPFESADDWMAAHLAVHPRARINKLRVLRVANGPVLELFEEVFTSSVLGLRKPDPEAYLAVSARMGVEPAEVHFFDDSPVNVDAARDVGMAATLVGSIDDVEHALAAPSA